MTYEEAKHIHRRIVRKVGKGTYNPDRESVLWQQAQDILFPPSKKK